MNYALIEAFLTVVSTQNISKAAEILFISQPALSQRLSQLESRLNTKLLVRSRGSHEILLTADGYRFLSIAEAWRDLYNETNRFSQKRHQNVFTIGAISSLSSIVLSNFFSQLISELPDIEFSFVTDKSYNLYTMIENRSVDVALCIREMDLPHVKRTLICTDEIYFIRSTAYLEAEHALNEDGLVVPSQLDPSEGLFVRWSPGISSWYQYWFGNSFNRQIKVDNPWIFRHMLLQKNHWSTIPGSLLPFMDTSQIAVSPFASAPPDREIYMLHREHADSDQQIFDYFVTHLKQYFENYGYFKMNRSS